MISAKTKRVAGIAAVLLVAAIVLTIMGIRTIIAESEELSEQIEAIAVDQSQQVAFTRLQKLMQETADDRSELQSYYLSSQSDSIDFLNYIEQLAADRGVAIETRNPTEVERETGGTYLSVGYTISGGLTQVESFIQLLETIPYVSELTSVRLVRQSPVVWEADVMIDVAVLSYD